MATLTEQLTEARAAYHDLMTGKAVRVVVDMSGERVEFVSANSQKLYTYIQSLERQIAPAPSIPVNAPARFIF